MTTTLDAPAESHVSRWEDFVDILYAPRSVFARRDGEESGWGVPLLVLTLIMVLLTFASQSVLGPLLQAEFARAMRNAPAMTAEQMAQGQQMARTFGTIAIAVTFPIGVLLVGLIIRGVGMLFDSVASLSACMLIATYSMIPRIIQQALSIAQGLVLDVGAMRSIYGVTLSPARFLDPDGVSALTLALAGRLDLFIVWGIVLIAIGLQVLGRVNPARAWIAASVVWLIGAMPVVIGALAQPG